MHEFPVIQTHDICVFAPKYTSKLTFKQNVFVSKVY